MLAKSSPWRAIPDQLVVNTLRGSCCLDARSEESEASMNSSRYPKQWTQLAQECKERAGWRCQKCGIRHGQIRWSLHTGRAFPVWLAAAHTNHDPENER